MSPTELEASKERLKLAKKVQASPSFHNFLRILMPWYDPAKTEPPQHLEEVLIVYSA